MQHNARIAMFLKVWFVALLAHAASVFAVPADYPNPGTEAGVTTFSAGTDGFLVGYYTGASGGFTVLAGARIAGVDGVTGLNNKTSVYGQRFVFGEVNAGDSLAFFIDVLDTQERFYSDPSLNADRVNHAWASVYNGDLLVPSGFNIAFEDLFGGGDFNYSDHSFVIGVERVGNVPEPAAYSLFLLALGGLVLVRRRPAVVR